MLYPQCPLTVALGGRDVTENTCRQTVVVTASPNEIDFLVNISGIIIAMAKVVSLLTVNAATSGFSNIALTLFRTCDCSAPQHFI